MPTLIAAYTICSLAVAMYILRMAGHQRQIMKRMATHQLSLQDSVVEKHGD